MKNIFKSLLVPALALAVAPFFASCSEDRDDNPTLRQPTENLSLTAPAEAETTTYNLVKMDSLETNCMLTVTSTAPDYGFPALILYQIQVSLTEDFASARTLGDVNQTYSSNNAKPEISFKVIELNDSIISLYQEANGGANPEPDPMTVYIRVQASVNGSNTSYAYSTPVTLSVIAQYIERNPDLYYLVGDFGGRQWSNHDKLCVFYPQSTTIYSYTTQWTGAGEFKFWLTPDDWGTAYGAGDTDGILKHNNDGNNNIKVPSVGDYYTFTINMNNLTYTWTKLDNQTPQEYETMNISGDFNGWGIGGDGAMKEASPHNWYVHVTIPSDGTLKFRVADDWNVGNWGNSIGVADQYYGTGVSGGDNIRIPAGTYDIYFNDITFEYVFVAAE